MDKFNQLLEIAAETREVIESSGIYTSDLEGACAVASEYIVQKARNLNIRATFICGYYQVYDDEYVIDFDYKNCLNTNHSWIEYKNKIIDVTATQFAIFDTVHVVAKNYAKKYVAMLRGKKGIKFVNKVWPKEQQFKNVKNTLDLFWRRKTI